MPSHTMQERLSKRRIQRATTGSTAFRAGAERRKNLRGREKVGVVLKEFKRGTLHSGSGQIVKNRNQAIAIGLSEAGLSRK